MNATTKRPISWHERCLENTKASLELKAHEAARIQKDLERLQRQASFYEAQIAEAVRRGLDGFDAERFMKERPKKVAQ